MATTRQFDPSQQEVIAATGGCHLVLAPPGCGKTDILTERIVHAHGQGVDYADMLCLTFTNRAAKSMAHRIADRTGNPVPDQLYVGNIHRFCSQLLFAEGLVSHNSAIIDESDVENIIQEELCKRLNIQSRTTELMRYQHALWQAAMGMRGEVVLHGELLHIGHMHKLCDVLGMAATEESLGRIYGQIDHLYGTYTVLSELPAANTMRLAMAYQRYKEENDLLDYDDLLVLAYRYLLQPGEHRRYGWIEIDEVQDLNPLQFALVDLLAKDDATVVYLGDEQQAIFSFIGAKLEMLETLKQRCAGHLHHLHTNYRSPGYLLELQNDYAVRNLGLRRELLPTTDRHEERRPEDVCLLDVGDASLEAYYAARFAQRYGQMDADGRVAVLVSTNREADEVSETMAALHIPHFKISGTDLFSLPAIRLLLAHLTVLADETVFIAWARLLWGLGATPSYTAARTLMRLMKQQALLPSDLLRYDHSSYVQEFVKAYDHEELVIFDTETTGLDPENDDIVQIAAIRVRHGEVVGQPFNIMLQTDKELPATVGGHANPMIELYRTSRLHSRAEGLALFMDYCRGRVLVGHNAAYDYTILRHNLRRSCPGLDLEQLCPRCFDTLKYIRLVRPRLRHYKLVNLIETLHLEGENSHRADDDIMATLSLLRYCHRVAQTMVAGQQIFVDNHRREFGRFVERYRHIYTAAGRSGGLTDELRHAYDSLLADGRIEPVDKWPHLLHYLQTELIDTTLYPTLHSQLERYVTDLCTLKESDLCGHSLDERYIISTVHKAKGLEFDTVIVYRCIDGNYPGQRSWTEKQMAEDARRLFVALSRSKRRLMVLCDSYFRNTPHALSPFLDKVRGHFTRYHRTPDGKIRPD